MLEPTRSTKRTIEDLTSIDKAAIILIAMGKDVSVEIMRQLPEQDIEELTTAIARMQNVESDLEMAVLNEYHTMQQASEYISEGGIGFAQDILQASIGESRASEMIDKIQGSLNPGGFSMLKDVDSINLMEFLRNEHPQTIALILSQITPAQAAEVLCQLPEDIQADISMRLATMEKISPEVIREIEDVLEFRLNQLMSGNFSASGGAKTVSSILNHVERSTEKSILGNLEMENPELTSNIKNYMFVFEDLLMLDDRSIQLVVRDVDTKEMATALKAASDELREKIYRNLSSRVVDMIEEEIEFTGPVRLSLVEDAQKHIVDIVRVLEEDKQIIIMRGGAEGGEMFV